MRAERVAIGRRMGQIEEEIKKGSDFLRHRGNK
jgi:hypothetical protein